MSNLDKPGSSPITQKQNQEHLSGVEGITMLDTALAETQGISFADFARSPKGAEFLHTKKIVIAGAPQSGKSVLRELLKRSVRAIPNAPYPYFVTAAPDGEWAGFQESVKTDPELARKMKTDYKTAIKEGGSMFTPAYVKRISDSVKNLSAPDTPLNFLDIGGKMSLENYEICEGANGAVILCGEKAAKVGGGVGAPEDAAKEEMDPRKWKEFFTKLGIPVIGVLYSDYTGKEDHVLGVDPAGAYAGSSHYFERGEIDIQSRPAVRSLADYIVSRGAEREMYKHTALANLAATSRTARGIVDTSASADKAEKMMGGTGAEVAERAVANFTSAIEKLFEARDTQFKDAAELRTFVEGIAQEINAGITKEGVLIRESDSEKFPYTRIKDLESAMNNFYEELFERLQNKDTDSVELAAWIEYRVDLSDHFFADGCGKAAKAISSWTLMRNKHILPTYRGRD